MSILRSRAYDCCCVVVCPEKHLDEGLVTNIWVLSSDLFSAIFNCPLRWKLRRKKERKYLMDQMID